jgi:hypothetical protein|tara:strand:+ start:164 stop:547 length:384 start_codon:yes stop_codon:yes gene_type:complete
MFESFQDNESIEKIVSCLPSVLVKKFDKKDFYTPEEVSTVFIDVLATDNNIEYAYAMFCTQPDFNELANTQHFGLSYKALRLKVSKKCFDNWPRFNFDSLLNYSGQPIISDLVNEVTDISADIVGGF